VSSASQLGKEEKLMRKFAFERISSVAFVLLALVAGCGREQAPSPAFPTVIVTSPVNGATGVLLNATVSATFSSVMAPATISTSTFTLTGPGATAVAGAVTYSGSTATFTPTASLAAITLYTATITTGATDPGGNALAANFGLSAGHYSVNGHVDDGRGGGADCELGIEVQSPPPPPEQVELEVRLSLHSIYFATARPTAANPTAGLLGSQEHVLVKLAADFSRYLTFKPDAHLILGGHADPRGTAEFNKALTERRVERTKSFLVQHGVPADHIDTRSYGEEDQLTTEQTKEQIAQNPDITPEERQLMLSKLPILVLANNRRVDIT
jgi:outer membrane protein OmpA-like peptidoglycan-associated protein